MKTPAKIVSEYAMPSPGVLDSMPALGETSKIPSEKRIAVARFFTKNREYYACEFDPKKNRFFGFVWGGRARWCHFNLADLVECDRAWKPAPVPAVKLGGAR